MILKEARLKVLALLAALTTLLSGCGGSSDDLSGGTSTVRTQVLYGRAILDDHLEGAQVELTTLAGNPLGYPAVVVDSTGNFRIPVDAALPPEFRVRVHPGSDSRWDLPIVVDVQNFDSRTAVFPNILTTLAALYRERNGGSHDDAIAWVRSRFNIPAGVDLGYGIDESRRAHFRHSLFLKRAEERGGVSNYLTSLLEGQSVLGQIEDAEGGGVDSDGGNLSFGDQVGVSIIANIGADAIIFVGDKVFGLVAQSLGLNIGSTDETQEVAQQLDDIQSSLSALSANLDNDFEALQSITEAETVFLVYQDLVSELEPTLRDIELQTENLATVAGDTTITNAPFTPQTGLQNLLSGLSGFEGQSSLTLLENVLLGKNFSASLLDVYLQLLSFRIGVAPVETSVRSSAPVWANSPVLTNTLIFDPYENFLLFYSQQQVLALNLFVENANLSLNPSEIDDARASGQRFQASLAEERQRLGLHLYSDFYLAYPQAAFTDRSYNPIPPTPSGTLYYNQIQAPVAGYSSDNDDGQAFIDQCETFQAPTYPTGWRLPTLDELRQLYSLAQGANSSDPVAGLISMGFAVPPNWQGNVWYPDYNDPIVPFGTGTYYLKSFNFTNGSLGGYDPATLTSLFDTELPYIQVHDLPFDSSQTFEHIVASGFRPTSPPDLTLSEDNSQVTATYNGQDITHYCAWSSTSSQLEVRSLGKDAGKLIWHPGESPPLVQQTITATIQGMDESNGFNQILQKTIDVQVPSPAPTRTVTSILLSPSNSILLDSSTETSFSAVAVYSDQTQEVVTDQVVWSLELPDGSTYPPGKATINGLVPGILIFTGPILGDSTVVVKATLGAVAGTTQLEVATPF